ncbi:MAG: CDP-glucose 4,6-dehydratase [Byssovorax sp.]
MDQFYSGKSTLVTGHTGFKGAWLSHLLKRLGARVSGFALPPADKPSLFDLAGVAEGMSSTIGDVRNLAALHAVFKEQQPEIVLHLAAQALVRKSYREPVDTFSTNVMGTVNVLEAARACPSVRAVVIVTSDKCYENREWVWGYREDEAMGGFDPYSASKGCAELVAAAYRRSFFKGGAAVASARAGNVIGGGDWAEDRLIPDILRGILGGETIEIRNPRATRPWQHVLEPLSGYLLLAQRLFEGGQSFAEGWNFGPADADSVPVGEVARRLVETLGRGTLELWDAPPEGALHEAHALKLDCSKARSRLGWRPRLDFEGTLKLTAEWYRSTIEDPSTAKAMLDSQIDAYLRLPG